MRLKAETFEVENPGEAMTKFESLLGKLVKVPKAEVEEKRAVAKRNRKRKRKPKN